MELREKSVLVTGGAGFIGSHLVDAIFKKGPSQVTVIDDMSSGRKDNLSDSISEPNFKLEETDSSNKSEMVDIVRSEQVDVVFNLSVVPLPASFTEPERCVRVNIESVLTLCELAREDEIDALVHYSSSEVYGDCVEAPMDESHPLNGTTPYAASKISGDKLIQTYVETHDIDAFIIRPFNNFGPRQNYKKYAGVIPATIHRISQGHPPIIYGDGQQTRDFIYVKDTVDASIKLINNSRPTGRPVNVGSGHERSIEYIIKEIANYLNFEDEIIYREERTADIRRHQADISRLKDYISFEPNGAFLDHLYQTIDWYTDEFSRQPQCV